MARRDQVLLADVLPEHYQYRDEGCEVSPSCLNCPLPKCKHDEPGWLKRCSREQRDERILQLWREEGVSTSELARRFSLSTRSVFRILQEARPPAPGQAPQALAAGGATTEGTPGQTARPRKEVA